MESEETILVPVKTGHEWVYTVVYSPDMTIFATDREQPFNRRNKYLKVKIWDAKTGKLVATLKRCGFNLRWENAYMRIS